MEFSPSTLGTLLIVAIVLAIAAIVIGVIAIQGERRVRATYSRFARGRREDVVTLIEMHLDEVARLRDEVRRQRAYADHLRALLGRTVSRVGTVRYDAFDDMGGRLSFSMALLDEHGDGSLITAMNGRVQTRTYAKPVFGGTSPHNLSEEEVQAIEQALRNPRRPQPVMPAAALPPEQDHEGPASDQPSEPDAAAAPAGAPTGEGVVDAEALLGGDLATAPPQRRRGEGERS